MLFSNSLGYLDQDMFVVLVICSLFDTESFSQVDSPDSRGLKLVFNQLLDESDNLSQIVHIAKTYVTGMKTDVRKIEPSQDKHSEEHTLIFVFNQLMVH
jgi:hypothetical protein